MAARQLPLVAALAAVSATVALSFGRVFASDRYVLALLGAAVLPHLIGWVVRSRGGTPAVGVAASAVGLAGYSIWGLAAGTTTAGLPGADTFDALARRAEHGWDVVQQRAVPLPATAGTVLLAVVVVWIAASIADDLAFRHRAALGALAPGVMVLTWVLALGSDDGQAVSVAAFGVAAVCFLALQHQVLLEWRRTRLGRSGPLGAPRLVTLGIVAGLVAVPAGVAAAEAVPGGDKPLFAVGGLGNDAGSRSYRTTVAPLVDVSDKLKRGSEDELFTVRASRPDYWRITALDEYRSVAGGQWTLTAQGEDAVSEGLDREVPADALTQAFDIGPLGERWMPAAYEPVAVSRDDTLVVRASSTLVTSRQSVSGLRYTVRSVLPARSADDAARARTSAPIPRDLRRYTELPADFPDSIRGIADDETKRFDNPYDKAQALRDYFRNGFTYDTNIAPGDDEEAMANFLTQRRGFCVQFASTYAVMARAVGIPARVAVGFTPGDATGNGAYRVTNYDAHAWPEIWLNGLGWTHMFDPTPATRGRGGSALPDEVPPATVSPGNTAPATTQTPATGSTPGTPSSGPGATTPATGTKGGGGVTVDPRTNDEGGWSLVTWLVLVGAITAVLAAIAAVALLGGRARRRARRRARPDPAAAIAGAWEETLDSLREHGVETAPTETPLELASRAPRETAPAVEPPLRAVARAYTTARYGARPAAPEAAHETWHQVDALRDALHRGAARAWRLRGRAGIFARRQPEPAGWSSRPGPRRSSSTND